MSDDHTIRRYRRRTFLYQSETDRRHCSVLMAILALAVTAGIVLVFPGT